MSKAEGLEVLLTDEEQRGIVDGGYRSWVVPSIEDRKLSNRTTRTVNAEYLLTPIG